MTLMQLLVFMTVVDARGFTAAGTRLGMTQSAVSHALASLETELGVTLLERGRQGMTLTAVGTSVLQHAREIVARTEQIRQETAATRGLQVGRRGSFTQISPGLLPSITHTGWEDSGCMRQRAGRLW